MQASCDFPFVGVNLAAEIPFLGGKETCDKGAQIFESLGNN